MVYRKLPVDKGSKGDMMPLPAWASNQKMPLCLSKPQEIGRLNWSE
jgi:hypothetical protein